MSSQSSQFFVIILVHSLYPHSPLLFLYIVGLEYLQPTATSSGLTSSTTAPVAIATAAAVASPPCNQLAAATTTTAEVMPAQGNHDGDGAGENSTEKKEEDTEHQDVTSCGVQQLI